MRGDTIEYSVSSGPLVIPQEYFPFYDAYREELARVRAELEEQKRLNVALAERCAAQSEGNPAMAEASNDAPEKVNHPSHYQGGGMEAIDVIEAFSLGFKLGNAVKYILRAGKKGDRLTDLRKAAWYLTREIANEEQRRG